MQQSFVLLLLLVEITSSILAEGRVVISPQIPFCRYRIRSKCDCQPSLFHKLRYFDERSDYHFVNAIQCLKPEDNICFYGDSLTRQLFVEMACKYGHNHLSVPIVTPRNETVDRPTTSTLANGATMHSQFLHLDSEEELLNFTKTDHCNLFVFSFGIWYIKQPSFKKSLNEYRKSLQNTIFTIKSHFPQAPMFIKPTFYSSFETPCYFPQKQPEETTNRVVIETYENKTVEFNKILGNLCDGENCHVIGGAPSHLYEISKKSECERRNGDPVHWCQCQGRSSPVQDTAVEMLLQSICKARY